MTTVTGGAALTGQNSHLLSSNWEFFFFSSIFAPSWTKPLNVLITVGLDEGGCKGAECNSQSFIWGLCLHVCNFCFYTLRQHIDWRHFIPSSRQTRMQPNECVVSIFHLLRRPKLQLLLLWSPSFINVIINHFRRALQPVFVTFSPVDIHPPSLAPPSCEEEARPVSFSGWFLLTTLYAVD